MQKLHLSISLPASEADDLIRIFGSDRCRRTTQTEVGVWIDSVERLESAISDLVATDLAVESVASSLLPEFTSQVATRLVRLVPRSTSMPLNNAVGIQTKRSCFVTVPKPESILIAAADQNVRSMYCGTHLLISPSLITQINLSDYAAHQRVSVHCTTSVLDRLVEVSPTADRRIVSSDCFRSSHCRLCGGLCVFLSSILIEAERSNAALENSVLEYGYGHDAQQPLLLSSNRMIEPIGSIVMKSFLVKPVFQVDSEAHAFFRLCRQLESFTRSN